jgi:uncharacterized membrane protein HdeD (DUF308 family)
MDVALLARNWWLVALRGVAGIIFGILTFVMPGITLLTLVLLFGGYALVEGVLNVIAAVRGRRQEQRWWALLIEGLVSLAAGIVTFVLPGLTAVVLLYLIAAWAIITGVFELVAAIRLRHRITGEMWLALSGVASIVFGVLMAIFPGAGALAVVLWIGAYAIVFGALLLGLAFRLRRWHEEERVPIQRAA